MADKIVILDENDREDFVSVAGDTMTGDLNITNNGSTRSKLNIVNTNVQRSAIVDLDDNGNLVLRNFSDANGSLVQLGITKENVSASTLLHLYRLRDGEELEDYVVYHTGNKPSHIDVGAVSKTGDTMTGNLRLEKSLPDIILKNSDTGRISRVRTGSYSAQLICNDDETDTNNYRRLVVYSPEGHTLDNALEFHEVIDGEVNIYQLYGTHNKPTPVEIKAAPEYGFGTNNLTAGTSPLASGHLYFVYK